MYALQRCPSGALEPNRACVRTLEVPFGGLGINRAL